MTTSTTPRVIHPVNEHLVPKLLFDDYPQGGGNQSDAMIAHIFTAQVLSGEMGITEARNKLWTYPNREYKLCSFDRWLMDSLVNCADRPAPYLP